MKQTLYVVILLFSVSAISSHQLKTSTQSSPSPQGDTHMGSDAAKTGTDINDKDIQAQEDIKTEPHGTSRPSTTLDKSDLDHVDVRTN